MSDIAAGIIGLAAAVLMVTMAGSAQTIAPDAHRSAQGVLSGLAGSFGKKPEGARPTDIPEVMTDNTNTQDSAVEEAVAGDSDDDGSVGEDGEDGDDGQISETGEDPTAGPGRRVVGEDPTAAVPGKPDDEIERERLLERSRLSQQMLASPPTKEARIAALRARLGKASSVPIAAAPKSYLRPTTSAPAVYPVTDLGAASDEAANASVVGTASGDVARQVAVENDTTRPMEDRPQPEVITAMSMPSAAVNPGTDIGSASDEAVVASMVDNVTRQVAAEDNTARLMEERPQPKVITAMSMPSAAAPKAALQHSPSAALQHWSSAPALHLGTDIRSERDEAASRSSNGADPLGKPTLYDLTPEVLLAKTPEVLLAPHTFEEPGDDKAEPVQSSTSSRIAADYYQADEPQAQYSTDEPVFDTLQQSLTGSQRIPGDDPIQDDLGEVASASDYVDTEDDKTGPAPSETSSGIPAAYDLSDDEPSLSSSSAGDTTFRTLSKSLSDSQPIPRDDPIQDDDLGEEADAISDYVYTEDDKMDQTPSETSSGIPAAYYPSAKYSLSSSSTESPTFETLQNSLSDSQRIPADYLRASEDREVDTEVNRVIDVDILGGLSEDVEAGVESDQVLEDIVSEMEVEEAGQAGGADAGLIIANAALLAVIAAFSVMA